MIAPLKRPNLLLLILLLFFFTAGCNDDDDSPESCELPFNEIAFAIAENADAGTVVGDASIVPPSGKEVSYSITSGNDGNTFGINTAGEISVLNNNLLDYEQRQQFELEIAVTAEGCTDGVVTAIINLLNEKDELYSDQFFENISKSELISYGPNGDDQVMYIYEPVGADQAPRPVLVFAGGGAFLPSNLDVLDNLARRFAGTGYVVALMRYISDPNRQMDPFERFVTAVHDVKAAIRFFRKDQDTDNLYNIDPDNIFVGGHGTGAFIALQAAYARADDFTPAQLELVNSYGGDEGERGNPGYSSSVNGVASLAGAIYDLNFIDAGEPPISCIHNVGDTDVNCEEGLEGSAIAYGSCRIIAHAESIGLDNQFSLLAGNSHGEPVVCADCHDKTMRFFLNYFK
ncbi:cadherin domain-containing protein [Fulvivirga sedimenti]|uniref:Cadherin domain-containing protein n=1 Tax=Fulvivirga sedimenti TaxID=2879465 RepID=A0A9X1KX90_9BACT|nr:cadherin domain-containing protein [Fulvivirga sedimenti]MCA6075620.1 cadherin domain-containing protein [Fulvivirga sedimenti]